MKDWIKFFPFAARCDNHPAEIKGPYFPQLKKNKWFLGDSVLHFGAPASNPVFGLSHMGSRWDSLSPGYKDVLKTEWDWVYGGVQGGPPPEWRLHIFYSNTWYFVGPWFTGEQARLKATALLATADDKYSFSGKNLFHPKVFESAVANYLDVRYGYDKNGPKQMYRGPLNWQVLAISKTIQAVLCDIHEIGNGTKDNPYLYRLIFFPITSTQFIEINFDFAGVDINYDEVRTKPLLKLCDDIISTFRLEVGEQTLNEWNKVKANCPDMSITESMEEFPWPLKINKKPTKKAEVDITPRQNLIE